MGNGGICHAARQYHEPHAARDAACPRGVHKRSPGLIGRSLRAAVDLNLLGDRQITVDCDVLQADGGTRTASITGGYVALAMAIRRMHKRGLFSENPLIQAVAAVSVGMVDGAAVLDLDYALDLAADVDLNVVMTGRWSFHRGTGDGGG